MGRPGAIAGPAIHLRLSRGSPSMAIDNPRGCPVPFRFNSLPTAAALAATASALPAAAQWVPSPPAIAAPLAPPERHSRSPIPVSGAVSRFYEARGNQPIWFRDGPRGDAAMRFILILQRSPIDGFRDGPRLAALLRNVSPAGAVRWPAGAAPGRPHAVDRLRPLRPGHARPGDRRACYGSDELVRPTAVNAILSEAASAPDLARHLRELSDVNPVYAQLRDAAWSLAQMTGGLADQRVMANLAARPRLSVARPLRRRRRRLPAPFHVRQRPGRRFDESRRRQAQDTDTDDRQRPPLHDGQSQLERARRPRAKPDRAQRPQAGRGLSQRPRL